MLSQLRNNMGTLTFNILFWFVMYMLVIIARFYEIGTIAFIQVDVEIPNLRLLVNGIVLAVLIGVPYTIMDIYLKGRGMYEYSLLRIIVNRSLIQIVIAALVLILTAYLNFKFADWKGEADEGTLYRFMFSPTLKIFLLTAMFGNVILTVYRTLQMKIGESIFFPLLSGKFRMAKEEDRMFLFLDLKSSTTIAERLGHELYSYFIQDCFRDLHAAVLSSQAEIYQYVGDEAILTWYSKDGLNNNRCLKAYFTYDKQLQDRSDYYESKYGVVPMFKAGLNMGKVMTAEVGVVKRDIAYHSDVLNTAARIQGLCNEKGARLLVAHDVIDKLVNTDGYEIEPKGEVLLRGKNEVVEVFEVRQI